MPVSQAEIERFRSHNPDELKENLAACDYLRDQERIAWIIAPDAYALLGDAVFGWLLAETATRTDPNAFWLCLSEVGYFSDGYPETFIEDAAQIIEGSEQSPIARVCCAEGMCRYPVLYRAEPVLRRMEEIALSIDAHPLPKVRGIQVSHSRFRSNAQRFASARRDHECGRIIIPASPIESKLSRDPHLAALFDWAGFGNGCSAETIRAILYVWGVQQGGRKSKTPLSLESSISLPRRGSEGGFGTSRLRVVFESQNNSFVLRDLELSCLSRDDAG